MALLSTSTRSITTKSNGEEMTDELYSKLSAVNQLAAMLAEALEIVPLVSEYKGNYYVSRETVDKIVAALK
jgi:hypothetical protein